MASLNKKPTIYNSQTYEGAKATIPHAEEQLRRSIMACMLWEKQFYEDGEQIADRICSLIPNVSKQKLEEITRQAKYDMKIRHAPLLLTAEMAKYHVLDKQLVYDMIRRPDELAELLAIYWRNGKIPIAKQLKIGLAKAFTKFDEYQLAKWNRDREIKLKDVLFLVHAKPKNKEQADLWKKLINNTLAIPDTWEVELSKTENKTESWTRLLKEKRLGAQALLMNLRNISHAKVDEDLVRQALLNGNYSRVLPFQFINAARYNPDYEPEIEQAMFKSLQDKEKLPGRTILLIDVSGSMIGQNLSGAGNLNRDDVACGLAMVTREKCDAVKVYTFSQRLVLLPPRRGFALRDSIFSSQINGATYLGKAVQEIEDTENYDRLIVITDEQSHDTVHINKPSYIINVGSYGRGVAYGGKAIHISGWSEKILDYIMEYEKNSKE